MGTKNIGYEEKLEAGENYLRGEGNGMPPITYRQLLENAA